MKTRWICILEYCFEVLSDYAKPGNTTITTIDSNPAPPEYTLCLVKNLWHRARNFKKAGLTWITHKSYSLPHRKHITHCDDVQDQLELRGLKVRLRDRWLLPRFILVLPSSGVRWFETDVSGLLVGSTFKGSSCQRKQLDSLTLKDGTDR